MSSTCSSPLSQSSSRSSTSPLSPQTAATTPRSSIGGSPKFDFYDPPQEELLYTHMPSPSPSPLYLFSQAPTSPRHGTINPAPTLTPEPVYDQYNYQQQASSYYNHNEFSGYPPASAFYGPLPGSSVTPLPIACPVDPKEYKAEEWQTADGQKVEYSAMHLHCATM